MSESTAPRYTGFVLRAIALVIDGAVLAVVTQGTLMLLPVLVEGGPGADSRLSTLMLFLLAFPILYFAIMEALPTQGTIGKVALGLAVTDQHGRRISLLRSLVRTLAKVVSYASWIGFPMAAFTQRKQGLHDKIAGTLVMIGKGAFVDAAPEPPRSLALVRAWRGEMSLAFAFWVIGVLGEATLAGAVVLLAWASSQGNRGFYWCSVAVAFFLVFVWVPYVTVCIWRCAANTRMAGVRIAMRMFLVLLRGSEGIVLAFQLLASLAYMKMH